LPGAQRAIGDYQWLVEERKRMRRVIGLVVAVAVIAATLVSVHPRGVATAAARNTAGLGAATFNLNWLTNVEFSGLWVADQMGWFKKAGITFQATPWNFTANPVDLVIAGKYNFGFQDGASIIISRSKGAPVKAIWAGGQLSPFCFMSMPKSGITTVKDFRGKRIGYQSHELYVLQAMLAHEGMTLADVHAVPVGFDPAVLTAGTVDAYLCYISNEPITLQQQGINVHIIPAYKYGYTFYSDVMFTTDDMIAHHPALVKAVVTLVDRGWRYAVAHPVEVATMVVDHYFPPSTGAKGKANLKQQIAELKALIPLSEGAAAPSMRQIGTFDAATWQEGINLLLKYKIISQPIPPSSVYTNLFHP
jgi:ABC-type nitrate/sulfonate/bicarbonate transport system substrate-binding protein